MADQRQLWPLTINWRGGLIMAVEYRTSIFTSRDKHEYRRREREQPRIAYEYQADAHGTEAQDTIRTLDTLIDENLVFAHPVFKVKTTTPLLPLATAVDVDSVPAWLTVGRFVVFDYRSDRFLAEVVGVSGTTIEIDAPSGVTIPAGAKLMLGVLVKVSPTTRLTYLTNGVLSGKAILEDIVGLNYYPADGTEFANFNSKEVLLKKPNWAAPVEHTFNAGIDIVDYEYGRREYDGYLEYVPHIQKADYLLRDFDDAIEFLQFFVRQRGRCGEFYMPTWTDDLPLSAGLTSGQNTFRVAGSAYEDYADNPAQRNVMVMMKDGSTLYRRITAAAVDGDDTVFTVAENWASTVALSSIAYCCWLNTYRFAVDELSLEWRTDSVAQFSTSFQLLRDLDDSL